MISARFVTREADQDGGVGAGLRVMAAAYTAERAGMPNVITYDMGGTSTDVGADPQRAAGGLSNEIEIEYAMADPRADGRRADGPARAAARIARLDDAGLIPRSGRKAPARGRGYLLWTAVGRSRRSPTPISFSAG